MIIDLINHFKNIQKESNLPTPSEFKAQVKSAMAYLRFESQLRKLTFVKK